MTSCLGDISLGHVETYGGEPWPSLFEKIESTSGAAAHVEKPETALIAPGKYLVERPQRLSPSSVGRSVKKNFDLGIVALRRFMRHPAPRLVIEILQIVAGPFAACFIAQHFKVLAVFTAAVDAGQILEEHARSMEQCQQRTIMIGGQGIDTGLEIGGGLQGQGCHVRVKTSVGGHRRTGKRPGCRELATASAGHLRQVWHDHRVT